MKKRARTEIKYEDRTSELSRFYGFWVVWIKLDVVWRKKKKRFFKAASHFFFPGLLNLSSGGVTFRASLAGEL